MTQRNFDLQDRLVKFSVRVIRLSEALPETRAGKHIATQLLRSGTSAAPNYGEAQSAESRADFVHKLRIALKELRETGVWVKTIAEAGLVESTLVAPLLRETEELTKILFASVETAKSKTRA